MMTLINLTRFRWPLILAAAVLIVATGYAAREWARLLDVRQQFDAEWRNWQTFRTTAENVVLTSARLHEAEAVSPWISQRTARERHLERMDVLLESVQSPPPDSPPHVTEREAEIVRREIDKHRSASMSDP
jgi:hypothetical protein